MIYFTLSCHMLCIFNRSYILGIFHLNEICFLIENSALYKFVQ